MYELIFYSLLVITMIIFEIYWFKNDNKQILKYVTELGGELISSKRVFWEHIYKVDYKIDDTLFSKTVKFTATQDALWY